MSYNGIVFFDYDGTVTDTSEGINYPTERTLSAFERLRKNGFLTVLCTGRPVCYAKHVIGFFDAAATLNGMYIVHGKEVILDNPVNAELSKKLLDYMDFNGINYCADAPEICYSTDIHGGGFLEWTAKFGIDRSCFTDRPEDKPERVYKVSVIFDNVNQRDAMKKYFDGVFNIDMQTELFGDISPCGEGKGKAVRVVAEQFGVSLDNTYAFGDGENDVPMLLTAAHGIAIGKHSPALLDYAEFVTKTVKEEGIEYGLLHYGLI